MTELKSKLLGLTKLRYEAMPLLMTNMQELVGVKDPILPLLKCHLLTEILLDRLIELAIEPNGKAVTEASLSYSKKLEIASKMMLIDDFELIPEVIANSLRKLNRLRNRIVVHRI